MRALPASVEQGGAREQSPGSSPWFTPEELLEAQRQTAKLLRKNKPSLMEEIGETPLAMLPGLGDKQDADYFTDAWLDDGSNFDKGASLASIILPGATGPLARRLKALKDKTSKSILTPMEDAIRTGHGTTHEYNIPSSEGMLESFGQQGLFEGEGFYTTPATYAPVTWASAESKNLNPAASSFIHETGVPLRDLPYYMDLAGGATKEHARFAHSQSQEVLDLLSREADKLNITPEELSANLKTGSMPDAWREQFSEGFMSSDDLSLEELLKAQAVFRRDKLLDMGLRGNVSGDTGWGDTFVTFNPDQMEHLGRYELDRGNINKLRETRFGDSDKVPPILWDAIDKGHIPYKEYKTGDELFNLERDYTPRPQQIRAEDDPFTSVEMSSDWLNTPMLKNSKVDDAFQDLSRLNEQESMEYIQSLDDKLLDQLMEDDRYAQALADPIDELALPRQEKQIAKELDLLTTQLNDDPEKFMADFERDFGRFVEQENLGGSFGPFSTTSTGRKKWDELLASDKGSVEYMSPDELMKRMSKGQNTSTKASIARRKLMGGDSKVEDLQALMSDGKTKMDMPVLDYAEGGFVQDGYHRALAAKKLGLKRIPVAVIRR